jgi:hypothetical protein
MSIALEEHISLSEADNLPESASREHEQNYRKFLVYARAAALASPFFGSFVLYWTT